MRFGYFLNIIDWTKFDIKHLQWRVRTLLTNAYKDDLYSAVQLTIQEKKEKVVWYA